jgi:hypothetical protein
MPGDSKLTRIGVFYDGNFFFHVSNYYHYSHEGDKVRYRHGRNDRGICAVDIEVVKELPAV